MRRWLITVPLLCFGFTSTSLAEEAFYYRLPEDGVWNRYHVNLNIAGVETASPWVFASVGRKTVDGKPCRWLELRQMTEDSKQTLRVIKALIPEDAFGKEKDPTAAVKLAWTRLGEMEPQQMDLDGDMDAFNRFVMLVLRGPTKNLKVLEESETVDWQRGKLDCRVITGESRFESDDKTLKVDLKHRLLINDKIPFRLAGSQFKIDVNILGQDVEAGATFTIVETGNGAKSVLPNVE